MRAFHCSNRKLQAGIIDFGKEAYTSGIGAYFSERTPIFGGDIMWLDGINI